jgi:hypothetical protein
MFTEITKGIIKAVMMLAQQTRIKQTREPRYPRYRYEPNGVRLSLNVCRSCLTEDEMSTPLAHLPRRMITAAPMYKAIPLDHSRYTGEKLREIRANGGGKRERERRLRQMSAVTELAIAAE